MGTVVVGEETEGVGIVVQLLDGHLGVLLSYESHCLNLTQTNLSLSRTVLPNRVIVRRKVKGRIACATNEFIEG